MLISLLIVKPVIDIQTSSEFRVGFILIFKIKSVKFYQNFSFSDAGHEKKPVICSFLDIISMEKMRLISQSPKVTLCITYWRKRLIHIQNMAEKAQMLSKMLIAKKNKLN